MDVVNTVALLRYSFACSTQDSKAKTRTDCNGVIWTSMTDLQGDKRFRNICPYDERDLLPFNFWKRNIVKVQLSFFVNGYALVAQRDVKLLP